eukprot:SAG22_NODE_5348_length_1032_cov_0.823151_1_plen_153_part_00
MTFSNGEGSISSFCTDNIIIQYSVPGFPQPGPCRVPGRAATLPDSVSVTVAPLPPKAAVSQHAPREQVSQLRAPRSLEMATKETNPAEYEIFAALDVDNGGTLDKVPACAGHVCSASARPRPRCSARRARAAALAAGCLSVDFRLGPWPLLT